MTQLILWIHANEAWFFGSLAVALSAYIMGRAANGRWRGWFDV
ncbi:hypothetical protein [Lacticaseibacillus nasuensis]|nr:hypothetical protein [Lacticaseibacillus nasuensis]